MSAVPPCLRSESERLKSVIVGPVEASSAPADVLEDLRQVYSERWQPSNNPTKPKWAALRERDKPKQLTTEEVRAAANAFPWTTSATHDGFHVKRFGMLSDSGTEVLVGLFEAAELSGTMPEQLSLVTLPYAWLWRPMADPECYHSEEPWPENSFPSEE